LVAASLPRRRAAEVAGVAAVNVDPLTVAIAVLLVVGGVVLVRWFWRL
jgi:hypothetical protein